MVALLILTLGVLAMAGSTGYITVQTRIADVRTERVAVVRAAIEELRATSFDAVQSVDEGNATAYGDYEIWWTVTDVGNALKEVDLYTRGPGYRIGDGWVELVEDTVGTSITRPYP